MTTAQSERLAILAQLASHALVLHKASLIGQIGVVERVTEFVVQRLDPTIDIVPCRECPPGEIMVIDGDGGLHRLGPTTPTVSYGDLRWV